MRIAWGLLLGAVWTALHGNPNLVNFAGGTLLGLGILHLLQRRNVLQKREVRPARSPLLSRIGAAFQLAAVFLYELVLANFRLAQEVLKRRMTLQPGFIAYPLRASSNLEITTLAIMISLTPGTLSVALSEDRTTLFIHATQAENPEQTVQEIRKTLEDRILAVTR